MTADASRHARVAVSAMFLLNGAAFANIVPRFPEVKELFGLSNTGFGLVIASYPLGAVVVGTIGGFLVQRFGSRVVATLATAAVSVNLLLLGNAGIVWVFVAALFAAGALDATADVANNTQGLRVERLSRGSVLNSMHGLWSVGAVIGGLMGAGAAGLHVPLGWHLGVVGVLFAALAILTSRFLLPGHEAAELDATANGVGAPEPLGRRGLGPRWITVGALLGLGLVAASANVIEDIGATWGALYLHGSLNSTVAVAGFGFIGLQAGQTLGRFAGDWLVDRFGDRTVARTGALAALIAMMLALVIGTVPVTIAAFAVVGAGIGTLIPAAFRTAEGIPGLAPGTGITIVSTVLRIALFLSPPLVGLAADAVGLRIALAAIPVAALVVLLLAGRLAPAASRPDSQAS